MFRVRCASCRRTVAIAEKETALRNKVYCDEQCYAEVAVTPEEERNDQWKAMVKAGWSPVFVAKKYGVPHSQVYKVMDRD